MGKRRVSKIDVRFERLERLAGFEPGGFGPGTGLTRVLSALDGGTMRWVLSIGPFYGEKAFFYGNTIEGCLRSAKKALTRTRKGRKRSAD